MKDKSHKFLEELQKRKALRLKQLEEIERQEKKLKEHLANLHSLRAECNRLWAENEKLAGELHHREAERVKKKPGARWRWKGEMGYHLICAVRALTADGTSVAEAIRNLHHWSTAWTAGSRARQNRWDETDSAWIQFKQKVADEHWKALRDECWHRKPRQLAARYHDALKAWGPYFEWDDALDAEMERFRAMSAATTAPSVTRTDEK
jgi:DNA repair exonuclease SbcCD ATPase subunit